MVSKLLLAVQENFFAAQQSDADVKTRRRLGQLYYQVREGIGFNKTPAEYGAFPADPYSHTPRHAGAKQPGMTGQVKEEILCRFGELGIRVDHGMTCFEPGLLRAGEFMTESRETGYVDVDGNWQTIVVPTAGLAFTWCQVPIVYTLVDDVEPTVAVIRTNGETQILSQLALPAAISSEVFQRSGHIRQINVTFGRNRLFAE